jgi:hypothetical protein
MDSCPLTGGAEYGYPAAALLVLIGIGCIGQVLETESRLTKESPAGSATLAGGASRLVAWSGAGALSVAGP